MDETVGSLEWGAGNVVFCSLFMIAAARGAWLFCRVGPRAAWGKMKKILIIAEV